MLDSWTFGAYCMTHQFNQQNKWWDYSNFKVGRGEMGAWGKMKKKSSPIFKKKIFERCFDDVSPFKTSTEIKIFCRFEK